MTLAMPLFENFPRDHVRTVPGDVLAKVDIRNFNRIGAIAINVLCMEPVSYTHLTLPTNREV